MPNREPAFLHHPHQAAGMFGSLQEAYDRLDAIIESSYDGIFITDGQAVTCLLYTSICSLPWCRTRASSSRGNSCCARCGEMIFWETTGRWIPTSRCSAARWGPTAALS